MELSKGTTFLPQFRASQPCISCPLCRRFRVSASFGGETFPISFLRWKKLEAHCNNSENIQHSAISKSGNSRLPELSFNRLQLTDQEYCGLQRWNFGRFVAREAILDEEYWTAAWLRAEAHWESLSYMRHVDSYKRKYAEEEFYALKRRCSGQDGNSLKCFCFVTVKTEEKNMRRTVLNSVVGTLDLSIRQYLQGETYPGEIKRLSAIMPSPPFDVHKYAYIANVCVSKFARRQGIALNMLSLASDVASSAGMKQLFVHVNEDNKPAQELYKRTGFKILADIGPKSELLSGKCWSMLSMSSTVIEPALHRGCQNGRSFVPSSVKGPKASDGNGTVSYGNSHRKGRAGSRSKGMAEDFK